MTFERFYSIIRPHKAASFNTVKRAKMKITCIIIVSIVFNIPHLYITAENGRSCVPFGNATKTVAVRFYYWVSLTIYFALPFVLLLTMNCFIIHTIHKRSRQDVSRSVNLGKGKVAKIKHSEMQMFVVLLLITFSFLVLVTPSYVLYVLYAMFLNYKKSAQSFAGFTLFNSIGQKTYYTNYAINFFLYVISGKNFEPTWLNCLKPQNSRKIHLLLSLLS